MTHSYLEDARSDRIVTYADLATSTRALGAASSPTPAAARDASVLLDVDDPLDFATCYLGVIAAGRCVVPIDPAMPDGEFTRAIEHPAPGRGHRHQPTRRSARCSGSTRTPDAAPAPPISRQQRRPTPGRLRLRTSGSTGEPKVVELTEAQLLHVARAVATHNGLTTDDRGFNPLPLFHINGEVVALLATLVAGATLVLDRRFHRDGFWALIERAPHHLDQRGSGDPHDSQPRADPGPSARAAAGPIGVGRAARRRSGPSLTDALGEIVVESYGMTEAASQITATTPGERLARGLGRAPGRGRTAGTRPRTAPVPRPARSAGSGCAAPA